MIMFKFFLSIGMYIIGKWILWYIKKWFCFVFKIKLWSFFVVIFTSQYNVQYGDTKDEEVDVELNRIEKKCFYFWTIKSAMRFMRFIVRKSNKNSIEGHRTWHKKEKFNYFRSFRTMAGWALKTCLCVSFFSSFVSSSSFFVLVIYIKLKIRCNR